VGSKNIEKYIKNIQDIDLKQVNVWYVTDTGARDKNTPQIYVGLRGLLYTELFVPFADKSMTLKSFGMKSA
jgi:hypothetical protein